MTHTKHRKRRERYQAEQDARLPGMADLRRMFSAPIDPQHPYWTVGRTGRAG